jgi:hypothetical protein
VPERDGQWLFCQQRSGKPHSHRSEGVKSSKIFAPERFTFASRTPDSTGKLGFVNALATGVNGFGRQSGGFAARADCVVV